MKPLIKWPGGKSSELNKIKGFLPLYDRYVEPFLGGGALFFDLSPKKALIGDLSENLMLFYTLIREGSAEMERSLLEISDEWDAVRDAAEFYSERLLKAYRIYQTDDDPKQLDIAAYKFSSEAAKKVLPGQDSETLSSIISKAVSEKLKRTAINQKKLGADFRPESLKDNIVTGFTAGYYYFLRNELNLIENGKRCSLGRKAAVFFFVREYCYGSMFRYNAEGCFNIPYGGISYNKKDLRKKAETLFSGEARRLLEHAELFTGDFETMLEMTERDDFVFLDPPYDTRFSDYEKREFGHADQRRLCEALKKLKAKFMLVIKNSDFIDGLYGDAGFGITSFDNTYSYCARGRNDRKAMHLVITNYLPQ